MAFQGEGAPLIKDLYKAFFHIPKNRKITEKVFCTRITLSILTMLICCAVFCSTTLAYFTSTQSVGVDTIRTASASATIKMQGETIGTCSYKDTISYECPLSKDDLHTFTLTAIGTASKGYCVINVVDENKTYNTKTLQNGESVTITLQAAKGTKIQFNSNWGEYEGKQHSYTGKSVIRVSTTPYEEYTVPKDVTLTDLAKYYGVSKQDILTYNGITKLTVGKIIKIPNTSVKEPYVSKQTELKQVKEQTKLPEEEEELVQQSIDENPINEE